MVTASAGSGLVVLSESWANPTSHTTRAWHFYSPVEFKLASNSQLESNLKNQLNIYKAANDTEQGLCVIVYTSDGELKKVDKILASLGLATNPNIILIDASPKTSASKVR